MHYTACGLSSLVQGPISVFPLVSQLLFANFGIRQSENETK